MNMKNLLIAIITLAFTITFTSCEKETSLTPNPLYNQTPSQPQSFQADIDSSTYIFNITTSVESSGLLNLEGVKGNYKIVVVTSSLTPGVYKTIDNGLNNVSIYINNGVMGIYSSAFVPVPDMEVKINSFDAINRTITGSFSGLVQDISTKDTIRISNGIFTNVKVLKGPDVNLGKMTAKIDGTPFESYFCVQTSAYYNGFEISQIDGSSTGVNKSLKLLFDDKIKTGTFNIDGSDISAQYYANLSSNQDPFKDIYDGISGSIVVSKVDTVAKIVEGTFNFEALNIDSDTVKVTDGKFEAVIQ